MELHEFILSKRIWIGEGRITFSTSPQHVKFYTKWEFSEKQPGIFQGLQQVEMLGVKEHVNNCYTFQSIKQKTFELILESEMMGIVKGTGIITQNTIAWELRRELTVHGFEVYERQENGDYAFHAEYSSPEHRTIVDGLIWKKTHSIPHP